MGDVQDDEPWIDGDRWQYFLKLCEWCRDLNLQVWPDIHTAPGSQNGFDNSGQQRTAISCRGWINNPTNVQRSLNVIRDISQAIVRDGVDDVVTGMGLLNEPFQDCDPDLYRDFMDQGLEVARDILGKDTAVYVSDLFSALQFNDGEWWLDPVKHNNTYLDSHYYHVFAQEPRGLSPRQHIALTCQTEYKADAQRCGTGSCCYQDGPDGNSIPSQGVKRLIGEWSAATDQLPVAVLDTIMQGIAATGTAPHLDRRLSPARKQYLKHFVEAQMVSYEANDLGVGGGFFYWTVKMEGGAFAEWDYLRGFREGWIPKMPAPDVSSESVFGSCYDIIFRTDDSMKIIEEFPPPADDSENWQGVRLDDDVVVSHGDSLLKGGGNGAYHPSHRHRGSHIFLFLVFVAGLFGVWRAFQRKWRQEYTSLSGVEEGISV